MVSGLAVIPDSIDLSKWEDVPPEAHFVRPVASFANEVLDRFREPEAYAGKSLPWGAGKIGIRKGEVSVWSGYNGAGKSMLLNQAILHLASQSERIVDASLEMPPVITSYRFARQALGGYPYTPDMLQTFFTWTIDRMWLYDQTGTVHWKRMLALARYCSDELGCTQFVIDSLVKCGIATDDYNTQKAFMDALCALAKDTGTHVHVVTHMRKGISEGHAGDKMSIRGAGEISDLVDNVFLIHRNKSKEAEKEKELPDADVMRQCDTTLACAKNRHGDWEGTIRLWFHPQGQLFLDGVDLSPQLHYSLRGSKNPFDLAQE